MSILSAKARVLQAGWMASFLLVLGTRWAVVDRFGSDLPQWDQWDAEGLHVLVPWYDHHPSINDFVRPQNEHRVVLTKLLNLGLTIADGQWDQRLECAVNDGLTALFAVALFAFVLRHLDGPWHFPFFVLIAAPLGSADRVAQRRGGFHSQQFFLLGLSFGAIVWLPRAYPGSARWWLGAGCAILALGSMGSGFLAAVVGAGLVLLRVRCGDVPFIRALPTLLLCAGVTLVGWLSRVTVAYHEVLKAHHVIEFYLTVLHSLQCRCCVPGPVHLALLIWIPWLLLAIRLPFTKEASNRDALGLTALGLGGWVLLQILAAGYARGSGGLPPASRYIDTLGAGAISNGLALAWLARGTIGRRRLAALGFTLSWGRGVWHRIWLSAQEQS